ncbi:MAG: hypothetical protein HRT83_00380 [Hyphomicrobiaceae bacterium]|nr:hypothetical protein [Hyphomicrobiaceae bacterium]
MRHALGVLGVLAAGVLLLVSAAMNWRFGYYLGTTDFDGFIYGSASAAADCMKALVPFFVFAAVRNKMWAQAFASCLVWAVVSIYSLTTALGYSALNRQDSVGARASQALAYSDLRSDLTRATNQLSWVPQHRPATVVKAAIDGMEVKRLWERTVGCTEVNGRRSRNFCNTYAKLKGEFASANEAEKLEARISSIRGKLDSQIGVGSGAKGDPQAALLAQIAGAFIPGVTVEHVQTTLVVFVSLLLEIGSSLGMYIAFSQWRLGGRQEVINDVKYTETAQRVPFMEVNEPTVSIANESITAITLEGSRAGANDNITANRCGAPESDVERYKNECIITSTGTSLTATTLYEDYCEWCDEQSKEPLALPTFGRELGVLGLKKAKISGRIRYVGVSFSDVRSAGEDRRGIIPNAHVA